MTPPTIPVARLSGVTLRYRHTVAVDAVDLDIPASYMVGFIGPDGVGKSSLLALLSGARKSQAGRVNDLGGDMANTRHRHAVCPRLAYMPQGLGKNLYPTLSVCENVWDFFGRLFGQSTTERAWRIRELLSSTGLAPFADRPALRHRAGSVAHAERIPTIRSPSAESEMIRFRSSLCQGAARRVLRGRSRMFPDAFPWLRLLRLYPASSNTAASTDSLEQVTVFYRGTRLS